MATKYGTALLGWLLGGVAPPAVMTAGLAAAVHSVCGDASDCSWGFEYVLVLPVLLGCFLGTGPALVGLLLARRVDLSLRRRARRATRRAALVSVVLLFLVGGSGLEAFSLTLVLVAAGVPAIAVWEVRRTAPRPAPPAP